MVVGNGYEAGQFKSKKLVLSELFTLSFSVTLYNTTSSSNFAWKRKDFQVFELALHELKAHWNYVWSAGKLTGTQITIYKSLQQSIKNLERQLHYNNLIFCVLKKQNFLI